ncbi:MAG: hypothetical protein WBB27_09395 [Maribacter sp.]
MFTKLPIPQRIKVGLILGIAFLLVFGSNQLDRRHFDTVQNTVNSVYKDRVVVQDFIYQLNKIFYHKELLLAQNQNIRHDQGQKQQIKHILEDFRATELTSKELGLLLELNDSFASLMEIEQAENKRTTNENHLLAVNKLNEIQNKLDGLAEIQLNESEQLTQLSNKSLDMNSLMSKLEISFLIIIGILMLALIYAPDSDTETNIAE